ncbi:hypothetical protein RHSIM_Rhsim08G0110100 [Rhododendron simsii]|uniref:Uncharacterized protein n=1 Tax=Rhododendron simsii TaxID=118357 RepID=A0A834GGZ1_RHOSS|nr:hypothetical protein RHSIM_Rhsim08G0110100 [Rhododendron simsii]
MILQTHLQFPKTTFKLFEHSIQVSNSQQRFPLKKWYIKIDFKELPSLEKHKCFTASHVFDKMIHSSMTPSLQVTLVPWVEALSLMDVGMSFIYRFRIVKENIGIPKAQPPHRHVEVSYWCLQ